MISSNPASSTALFSTIDDIDAQILHGGVTQSGSLLYIKLKIDPNKIYFKISTPDFWASAKFKFGTNWDT